MIGWVHATCYMLEIGGAAVAYTSIYTEMVYGETATTWPRRRNRDEKGCVGIVFGVQYPHGIVCTENPIPRWREVLQFRCYGTQ